MSNQRYSLDFHNLDRPKAQLLYVTCATSDRDWHSMEHAHSFSELFFVTKGSGFFQIGSKKIPVQKNDLIFINPNTPHTELGNREKPWEYVALGIEGVQFGYAQKGTPYDYSLFSLPPGQQEIRRYLDTLLTEPAFKLYSGVPEPPGTDTALYSPQHQAGTSDCSPTENHTGM